MKKIGVLLFVSILLLMSVKAEINLNSFEAAKYNIGEKVILEGKITDSEGFVGNLEVNSVCANSSKQVYLALIEANAVKPYNLYQEFPIKESMLGNCYFNINLKDENGEIVKSKSSELFEVTRELRVDLELNVLSQNPGKEIIVSGIVRDFSGVRVNSGSAVVTLNGKLYASGLSNGAFSYAISLPTDLDSGSWTIDVQATDLQGNEGSDKIEFKVLSVAKDLSLELDKETYNPGDNVAVKVILSDQSGKNLEGSSTIQLYDPNEDKEFTKVIKNGDEFILSLSNMALPGTWILEAENNDFKVNRKFFVDEVKSKSVVLKDKILMITNTGNVDYNEPVEVLLEDENGEEYQIIKKTSLKPNQTISIDLNKEVPKGNYQIDVGGNLITGNLIIEGSALGNLNTNKSIGYVALIFVFLFLIFVVVSRGRRGPSRREMIRNKGRDILSKPVVRKEDKKLSREHKSDVEFFVNKVRKENPVDKKEDKGNPFDFFN